MSIKKQCAVCGDTCSTNVRLVWRRDSDGKTVNVCMMCAESGKVNAESIDNHTGKYTVAVVSEPLAYRHPTRQTRMGGMRARTPATVRNPG